MSLKIDAVAVDLSGRRIVSEVTLGVGEGEVVGLIGPNGSGKSTLLRTVYRMLRPVAGWVSISGDDVWRLSARESARRTAVVVQEPTVEFDFLVREIVAMGRLPHKGALERDNRTDDEIVDDALERVEIARLAHRSFVTLSGGEKQRCLVARALVQQPQLLVMDEPTNHLDIRYQLDILELVRGLGVTTLVTLHDLNLAAHYCGRLYLLDQGRIVATGSPTEVLTPEHIDPVFGVESICTTHPKLGCIQLAFVPR